MDNDELDDGFVDAYFVGGAWDGKTYAIPPLPEFRVALMKEPHWIAGKSEPVHYDIAVYQRVIGEIYWFHHVEAK